MAVKALIASDSLNAGTNWRNCDGLFSAYIHGFATNTETGDPYFNAMTTTETRAITFSGVCNQLGVVIAIQRMVASSGTLTIKLQENVSGTWTDRTSDVFDTTTIPDMNLSYEYIPLTTYAVDGTASKWRYSVTPSVSSGIKISKISNAMTLMSVNDYTTTSIANNDTMVLLNGVELTFDKSLTLANQSGFFCRGAGIQWTLTPSAVYTFNYTRLRIGLTGYFKVGNSSTGNSKTNYASLIGAIDCTHLPNRIADMNAVTCAVELYGDTITNTINSKIVGIASAGQKTVITETALGDSSSIGLYIFGKKAPATVDEKVTYSSSKIAGTTVTLGSNLDYDTVEGAYISKLITHTTKSYGVVYQDSQNTAVILHAGSTTTPATIGSFKLNEVYINGTAFCRYLKYNNLQINNVYINHQVANTNPQIGLYQSTGGTISNIHMLINNVLTKTVPYLEMIQVSNCTVSNVYGKGWTAPLYLTGKSNTFTNFRFFNPGTTTGVIYRPTIIGVNNKFTDCTIPTSYGIYMTLVENTFNNVNFCYKDIYCFDLYGSNIKNRFINCDFSQDTAITAESYCNDYSYSDFNIENSNIPDSPVSNVAFSEYSATSKIRYVDYDEATDEHRVYNKFGIFQSTGTGLTDTTCHTARGYALRFESNSSTDRLELENTVPTGNIQNKTMTVAIWAKINSANYYSGTHQLPRLTIDYDNGTTAYAQCAETTDWQLLSITFTPTTTYGQITMTLSTMTDQTGSNAYVYFDDVSILYPAGYKLDLGSLDLWADGLPVSPYIATVLSAKDVWTASTTESYGSNTMGEQLKSAGTVDGILDEDLTTHTTANSLAQKVKDAELKADDAVSLILTKQ